MGSSGDLQGPQVLLSSFGGASKKWGGRIFLLEGLPLNQLPPYHFLPLEGTKDQWLLEVWPNKVPKCMGVSRNGLLNPFLG